jgi:hypothetical protein
MQHTTWSWCAGGATCGIFRVPLDRHRCGVGTVPALPPKGEQPMTTTRKRLIWILVLIAAVVAIIVVLGDQAWSVYIEVVCTGGVDASGRAGYFAELLCGCPVVTVGACLIAWCGIRCSRWATRATISLTLGLTTVYLPAVRTHSCTTRTAIH